MYICIYIYIYIHIHTYAFVYIWDKKKRWDNVPPPSPGYYQSTVNHVPKCMSYH